MLVSLPLRLAAITLALISATGSLLSAAPSPNVIVIFIDDMGWGDFSCFGNSEAKTPQIDQMAAEGIRFEQFYVNSPICSPSRVAITTGTYPQRWGITSYLSSRSENKKRGMRNWLNPEAPSLARDLQAAGYATGHFGKWHMGGQHDVADAPPIQQYGFDQTLSNFEGMGSKILPLITRRDGSISKLYPWEHLGAHRYVQRYEVTHSFVDAAINFIDTAQEASKPFYINVWPDDVHGPFYPSPERMKQAKTRRELYHAVLEEMDTQFTKLFEKLKSTPALRDNTILLICSDNGPDSDAGSAGPFKGFKTHLYEGGIRSPLIVWAPGIIPKHASGNTNTESVFSAIDLVPSLRQLCGVVTQQNTLSDGEALSDTLVGKSNTSRHTPLFFSRPPDRKSFYGFENLPDLAVRSGEWKLLCDYDGARPELYNLSTDRNESTNLAKQHPERVKQLTQQVQDWYATIQD